MWDLLQKPDQTWKLEVNKALLLSLKTKGKGVIPTGGTAMSFNSEDDTLFIVGSESGRIFKCSTLVGNNHNFVVLCT